MFACHNILWNSPLFYFLWIFMYLYMFRESYMEWTNCHFLEFTLTHHCLSYRFLSIYIIWLLNIYRRLQERNKRKKAKLEDKDFPRHEYIKFGEVVQGPPKLIPVPKVKFFNLHCYMTKQITFSLNWTIFYRSSRRWRLPTMLHKKDFA